MCEALPPTLKDPTLEHITQGRLRDEMMLLKGVGGGDVMKRCWDRKMQVVLERITAQTAVLLLSVAASQHGGDVHAGCVRMKSSGSSVPVCCNCGVPTAWRCARMSR